MPIPRGSKIYLKTPRISIEKHIKTACWQLSTYVSIKLPKNTVLIRVKNRLQTECFLRRCLTRFWWEIGLQKTIGIPICWCDRNYSSWPKKQQSSTLRKCQCSSANRWSSVSNDICGYATKKIDLCKRECTRSSCWVNVCKWNPAESRPVFCLRK